MTAREPSAVEVIAEALLAEGAAPGSSLHSWRCEYPDRYGPCECVRQTAEAVLAALIERGFAVQPPARKPSTVDGHVDRCPAPGYAGRHTAVGAGAITSPYRCHGCGAWFTLDEAQP